MNSAALLVSLGSLLVNSAALLVSLGSLLVNFAVLLVNLLITREFALFTRECAFYS
ncbi:hypothetical protein M1D47_20500 [Bacillus sp. R1-10]